MPLRPILAGILLIRPGARIEWDALDDGGWVCSAMKGERTLAAAADHTGVQAAIRVLGRLWASPVARLRGRRT